MLFLLYVNSLPDVLRSSQIAPFVDDTKALKEVISTESLSDQVTWSDSASLNFNYSKCKRQHITRKRKSASLGNALILIALPK